MHLVHYNSKYADLNSAKNLSDGLAVLGIFFELAEQSTFHEKYENKFIKYLSNIQNFGDSFVISRKLGFNTILDLIKYDVKSIFSYQGEQ
jgi:hypothetical protein